MKNKRIFQYSVVLALAALLINPFSIWAHPAEGPENSVPLSATIPCQVVLETEEEVLASIDIPSRRAEYAAIDRIVYCLRLAEMESTIPSTGRPRLDRERFFQMKERQAELMDRSGVPAHSEVDQRWIEFKERQAELMDRSK